MWLQGTQPLFNLLKLIGLTTNLPTFKIVSSVAIGAMQCVFLGVVKQLVGLWFNSKHNGKSGTMEVV